MVSRLWLTSFQVAQMLAPVAAITYGILDGTDFSSTYLRSGSVTVTNHTCYFHPNLDQCPPPVIQDQLAHAYGEDTQGPDSTSSFGCGAYTDFEDLISSDQNSPYYCRRNTTVQEFAYRFNEYNPDDSLQAYPHFTDRIITASPGPCTEYWETGNQTGTVGDDTTHPPNAISALNITYANSTHNGSILIPTSALGREGTTYIYRGPLIPALATTYGFGLRGLMIWAYRNPGHDEDSRFFECPITVNTVTNVQNLAHSISDAMAREAAASIALQGQFRGTVDDPDFTQWQWYASG